jgi:hypothetical protein
VITLMAGSTNRVEYYPSVAHSLPIAPILTITDGSGGTITISDSPSWDATTSAYVVAVTSGEVPASKVGETWTFVWTWVHEADVLRDVEWGVVISTGYEELTPALRRKLKDLPVVRTDDFIGDGTSLTFTTTYHPVQLSSQLVTVNSATTPSSGYSFHYPSGTLTFNTAPASGSAIRVISSSYSYSDYELEANLDEAVVRLNALQGTSYPGPNSSLSGLEKSLVLLLAMREVYLEDMMSSAPSAFSWKDEEKTVNKTSLVSNYKDALEILDKKIDQLTYSLVYLNTHGIAQIGGGEVIDFGSTNWED